MKKRQIVSILTFLVLATMGASAQGQRRSNPSVDRQVRVLLPRLEQTSGRFRNSLNLALVNGRLNETRSQNDINTFAPALESAIAQFRDRFNRRQATSADVQDLLQKASLVNGFKSRNQLNGRVQNDWAGVRTSLNSLANVYGMNWQWSQQTLPPISSGTVGLTDSELNQLIRRIETGGNTFRASLTNAFDRSRYNQTPAERNMLVAVGDFKNATDQLRNQYDVRRPVNNHVARVLAQAAPIDTYMRNNQLTTRAQNDWSTVRADLNTLAGAYNLSASWQNGPETLPAYNSNSRLTGTFRLDPSRSDNPGEAADRATRSLSNNERQSVHDRMFMRLESPEMLAIERRSSTMTIASSRASQSTFEADGVERQEQLNGRSSRVTAILSGDQLAVRSTGYRENDFNVTFESIDNGSRLRVKREIYSDRLTQPVVVNSVYNRTSDEAQWNVYEGRGPVTTRASNGEFIMRDGETVVATLDRDLTTKQAQPGDRFTMTVRDGEYQGAVIEGTVGSVNQGGRLTGRSGLSLNFDTMRLRNGQSYRFAGVLTGVRTTNGDTVRVDNEGGAQGDNQTTQTLERAGIGTAIGAIIGAVAGGGKGAAIGGIVGAAGGAGSVYVTGKDSLELLSGTELTVRASSPGR